MFLFLVIISGKMTKLRSKAISMTLAESEYEQGAISTSNFSHILQVLGVRKYLLLLWLLQHLLSDVRQVHLCPLRGWFGATGSQDVQLLGRCHHGISIRVLYLLSLEISFGRTKVV